MNLLVMLRKRFWNGKKKFINVFHKLNWTSLKKSKKTEKRALSALETPKETPHIRPEKKNTKSEEMPEITVTFTLDGKKKASISTRIINATTKTKTRQIQK